MKCTNSNYIVNRENEMKIFSIELEDDKSAVIDTGLGIIEIFDRAVSRQVPVTIITINDVQNIAEAYEK